MANTLEQAYAHHCAHMPALAAEARRITDQGGTHELRIITRKTKKRGYVCEMTSREINEQSQGRLIDLG